MKQSEILNNIAGKMGIESLNPMQKAVMDCQSKNIVLLSPTGSGKTLGFSIAMLQSLPKPSPEVKAVILGVGYIAVCWTVLWMLDRKKIYLKV